MALTRLLAELRRRDIRIWQEEGQLRYDAPKGALSSDLREQITRHRTELLELLSPGGESDTPPLTSIAREGELPLSFGQQRLWFLDQLEPESRAYNVPATVRLRGLLDVPALRRSLDMLAARHEAIRTTFPTMDGQPRVVIAREASFPLQELDLGSLPAEKRLAEAQRRTREDATTRFDLANGPLTRGMLIRLDDEDHILHISMHHIVSDGWSLGILFRELTELYEALRANQPSPLQPLDVQYVDFARWQQRMLAGKLGRDLEYWKQQLADLPTLRLPTDRPRPAVISHRGNSRWFTVPDSLFGRIQRLGQRREATIFMTLLAAFNVLLARHSGQQEIVVGTPIAGRGRRELEGIVGFFVNNLVLRSDLGRDPTFTELLRRVRRCVLDTFAHADTPFDKLVEELQPERDLGRNPLFQVLFNHFNTEERYQIHLHSLELEGVTESLGVSKFDLTLHCYEDAGVLETSIEYNTDLFDEETIDRFGQHYVNLLQGIADDPERPISQLPMLGKEERQRLLVEWNRTAEDSPRDRPVPHLFEDRAGELPDEPAVQFEDRQLTFAELEQRTRRVASTLRSTGLGRENRVALFFDRSCEMIVGLMAVLRAGGAYVPIDPVFPSDRVAFMLEDSGAEIILTRSALVDELPRCEARVLCLDREEEFASNTQDAPLPEIGTSDLACVMYTSGTTGRSKGVQLEHGQLLNYVQGVLPRLDLPPGSSFATVSTLAADLGNTSIYGALCSGGCLHVLSEARIGNGDAFAEYVHQHQVDCIKIVPSHVEALLTASRHPERVLPRKLLVVGGEASSWELLERIRSLSTRIEIVNHYGPTEAAVGVLTHRIRTDDRSRYPAAPPIGKPIANTRVYLLDANRQLVPIGAAGELHVGGWSVARGYLNLPEETEQKFIDDPFGHDGRLYRTGDLARYSADGTIHFLGRFDDQVKLRGFRIELGEIQACLEKHPSITAAACVVYEPEGGSKQLVAYTVAAASAAPSPAELREFLRERLPDYMVPTAWVSLDRLPLTPNGKLDRKALPAPQIERGESEDTYVAPRNDAERALARIWSEVLRVDRVGIQDNFFELGGESIISIQIISRASQAGLHLKPRDLFENPTIAGLARIAASAPTVTAELDPVTGEVPLTPIQHRFFELADVDPHHYNQAMLLKARRALDPESLERAGQALLEHHDALRLRNRRTETGWTQEIADVSQPVSFTLEDLSGLAEAERPAALEARASEIQAGMDLASGPLIRFTLFRLGDLQGERLLIAIHHTGVDGVSWRILLEDLQTAYAQLLEGRPVQLPPKTSSYRTWGRRLVEHARSDEALAERDHWLQELQRSAASLPVDHPEGRSDLVVSHVDVLQFELDAEATKLLLHQAPKAYRTRIDDALLTALTRALTDWIGSSSVRVDLEGHGRESLFDDVDLSRTVGWFTAVYPVTLESDEGEDPGELLRSIKEQLRSIPGRGVGWGVLRYLGGDEELTRQLRTGVAPEISFNYLGQFDQAISDGDLFERADESPGAPVSARNHRRYLLDVTAVIREGRLRLNWIYNRNVHERGTIEALSSRFGKALREVIDHCVSVETPLYTPSDFPLARLNQTELDRIQERYREPGIEEIAVLSPLQQGMLYHTLIEPESATYITQLAFTLRGEMAPARFERAWREALERHPVLRTGFAVDRVREMHQIVCHRVTMRWHQDDWRDLDAVEREQRLAKLADEDRQRGFDLADPPLMRLRLIRTGEETHRFIWTHHHVLMDGWSLPILIAEVFRTYSARAEGVAVTLDEPRPFTDYIRWLERQDIAAAEAYWTHRFEGWPGRTELPIAEEGAAGREPAQPRRRGLELSEESTRALQEFAATNQLTVNTLVQGAWALLLSRYSASTDVSFGVTVAGRPGELPGVETMLGMFINTLPMRVDTSDAPLVAWLQRIQEHQLQLGQYEYTPLFEAQRLVASGGATRLFDSILVFENFPVEPAEAVRLGGLQVTDPQDVSHANYPLAAVVRPGRQLSLELRYDGRRVEDGTAERLLGHFAALLKAMTERPDASLAELPMIDEAEGRRLLVAWNDTATDYPSRHTVHRLFEEQVAASPDATALVLGDRKVTYAELDRRANRLAHYLIGLGVGNETPVGLCVERSVEMVVGVLGILKAGGAYVPLDPSYPGSRLTLMLEETQASVLLTQQRWAAWLPDFDGTTVFLDTDWPTIADHPASAPSNDATADSLAYIIYTSGSTGRPKGVCVEHRSVVRLVKNTNYVELGPDEVFLQFAPISFDASTFELWGSLLNGARLVVFPPQAPSLEELGRVIDEQEITTLWLTAALFKQMVDSHSERLRHVRQLLAGGEELSAPHVRRFLTTLADRRLINGYGPTENTTFTCCHVMTSDTVIGRSVSIGRPISNTQVYVLDENMEPVAVGIPGRLYAGGDGLARCYLNDAELTASKFVPHPFRGDPEARLYDTGDMVRWLPDGPLEFLGRVDHQVKIRGFRVELGEIEAALIQHPGVRDAVVLCLEDRPGDKRLVGYVVPQGESAPSRSDLRVSLGEELPAFMIPPTFLFLDALPLTPNGKVDRRALPAPTAERQAEQVYLAPRGALEEQIAAIWREVLGIEQVGVRDNFFDLGGHSLRLLQVHARILDELGHEIPVTELFEYPTIEALARRLALDGESRSRLHQDALARVGRRGSRGDNSIAVIGMAGRFPGAARIETFWENLVNGVESVRFFTDEELREAGVSETLLRDPRYVKARAVIDDVDRFDARFFGYSPREAELLDPQHRVFMECTWETLERAGYDPQRYAGMIGVFAGVSMSTYLWNLMSRQDLPGQTGGMQLMISTDKDYLPTRVSYKLNLRGPSVNVQSACSTGLVAVHEACRSLLDYQCDMALAGGVSITVPVRGGYLFEEGGIRSPDGHNRAFDARAQGTVTGSGAAAVLLKRLDEALADGDQIHAVLLGTAINNDGSNKVGYTAPSVEGQAEVIALSQACAGVEPETIGYVEAHGTATALGDPIEVAALTKAFRERTDKRNYCGLGTLKSNMGHLNEAAGVAGLVKTVLALENRLLPPSLHYEQPNPEIDFDGSPFYVVTEPREWNRSKDVPRRAAVSSFGLGGTNAHAVLEEAPQTPPSGPSREWQLLTVSAKTASALETASRNLVTHLREAGEVDLADVAFTLALGRNEFDFRRAVVCRDAGGAVSALEGCGSEFVSSGRLPARAPSTVFMFPGHGHQHPNMGRGVYESEATFRNTMDACLSHLRERHEIDLQDALYPENRDARDSTMLMERPTIFQPAVFAVAYAMAQQWRSWGVEPKACIGHSLGEYVAACVAEVLSLEDALDLVVLRGRLMEQTPPGAMLMVSLPENRLLEFLADENEVWLSTINAPSLCLVAGKPDRIDAFAERLSAAGVECDPVAASHAYHSAMMESGAAPLADAVRKLTLGAPRIPYLSNLTGDWITEKQVRDPEYWARHLWAPVRFSDGLERLLEDPDSVLLEVGPGRILGSLARMHASCARDRPVVSSLRHPKDEASDMATLLGAAGRLWTAGLPLDWTRYFGDERRRRVLLPTYPFERKRYWVERRASTTAGPFGSSGRKPDVGDWFYVPVWRSARIPDASPAEAEARSCLAFVDDTDFSAEMVRRLERDGLDVAPVRPGESFSFSGSECTIDPGSPGDYVHLVEQLQKRAGVPALVAHLWCARPSPARMREDDIEAEHCQDLGFNSLLHLARALGEAEISTPVRIVVVTEGLHEVTGDEVLQPEKATILGPCRVLPREFSNLSCRNVDLVAKDLLQPSQELLERVARELLSDSPDPVVAYRGERRSVESFTPLRLEQAQETLPSPMRSGGTYLITGGLTGVGLALAGYLAQAARANLILTGRTPLPERSAWADHVEAHGEQDPVSRRINAVKVLEELGSSVMPAQADVSEFGRMQAVVTEALDRFDRIDGVIHAAGVPAAGLVMLQEPGQATRGLAPKVTGARVLERLFRKGGLDFLVLCSSLNSVKGVPGLVDYSAANAYLDVFARRFGSDTGIPTVTINWNRWREVGMAAEAAGKPLGEADGVSNLEGVEIFRRILASRTEPRVLVSEFDLWAVLASAQSGAEPPASAAASESDRDDEVEERPDLMTEFAPPETEMENLLAEIWQQVLGIDRVGVNDSFMELGGHSLAMLKVMSKLEERTGVKVDLRALFHQTLGQIAAVCDERATEAPRGAKSAAGALLSRLGRFVSRSTSDDEPSGRQEG